MDWKYLQSILISNIACLSRLSTSYYFIQPSQHLITYEQQNAKYMRPINELPALYALTSFSCTGVVFDTNAVILSIQTCRHNKELLDCLSICTNCSFPQFQVNANTATSEFHCGGRHLCSFKRHRCSSSGAPDRR